MGNYLTADNRVYGMRTKFTEGEYSWYQATPREDSDNTNLNDNKVDMEIAPKALKFLTEEDSNTSIISSTPKVFAAIAKQDFNEDFYIHEDELDSYCEGFATTIFNNIDKIWSAFNEEDSSDEDLIESAMDDEDVKLSLYRSFKSLYDKWISSSDPKGSKRNSGYFYNNYGAENTEDSRTLFEHFNFVNRTGGDIGGKAVVDISYLSGLSDTSGGQGPTQSLYNSLTNLLSKNNFDFFAMPNYVRYSDDKAGNNALEDMWRPMSGPLNPIAPQPSFVCMFIGGSSRALDIPRSKCGVDGLSFDYKDDSFDINEPSTYPADFTENTGGIVAFKVRYGQEAQNHFKSIQLDQAEFKETQESLLVIDALTNPKTGSQPSQIGKGNNLFDTYLTRSYSCDIETFGNFQLQPLMFFKLENVPMFRGTYMIINTSHSIEAHNVKTTFKGVRQPIVQVPLVTDALSLLDLALTPDDAFEGKRADLNNYVTGSGGEGPSIVSNLNPNSLVATKSLPPKNAPKLSEIISVMKKKKGVFNSKKLGNVYSNKPFSEVRDKLIEDGVYEPNKNYEILTGDFEVNVVGIRSYVQQANTFDDFMCVFYVDPNGKTGPLGKKWTYRAWTITTEPGTTALGNGGDLGTNLIAEGQYIKAYRHRRHRASEPKNNYSILGNDYNILIYRDANKDKWAQKDTKFLYVDTPGDNMHASGPYDQAGKPINGWSAGCQVFKDPKDFAEFIYITYFIAQNEKSGNSTAKLRLESKGGCGGCKGFLSDSIKELPSEIQSVMVEGAVVPKRLFNYTLLNTADFGTPNDVTQGDSVYENYINSGFHST